MRRRMLLRAVATLAVMAFAGAARGAPAGPVWVEVEPLRRGPVEQIEATWFEAPTASLIRIDHDDEFPLAVWNVEHDDDGRVIAEVEQQPLARDEGQNWYWVPPATGTWAVVTDARALPRLYRLRSAPELTRGYPFDSRRRTRPPGEFTLGPGEPRELQLRGAATLVVEARVVSDASSGTPEEPFGGPIPFELTLCDERGSVLAHVPATVSPGEPDPATGLRVSHARRLEIEVPRGPNRWELSVQGASCLVVAQLSRERPLYPYAANPIAPPASTQAGTDADSAARRTADALNQGLYRQALPLAGAWLEEEPGSVDALRALGKIQARVPPIPDVTPAALPALENRALEMSLAAEGPAPSQLRDALRNVWFEDVAYLSGGVMPPEEVEWLVLGMPAHDSLAAPLEGSRHRYEVRSAMPLGAEVVVPVPADELSPERWTILRFVGITLSRRAAVAALTIDGGEPERVLLEETVTPFRVAVAPGNRTVRFDVPGGGEGSFAFGVDLAPDPQDAGAPPVSPWGPTFPYLRLMRVFPVEAVGDAGVFQLPVAAHNRDDGRTHLRVEAWWHGAQPLELVLETPDGLERRVLIYPDEAANAAISVEHLPDGPLMGGAAPVDLDEEVGWVRLERTADGPPAWIRVTTRQPLPHGQPAEPEPELPPIQLLDAGESCRSLSVLSRILLEAGDDTTAQAVMRVARAELLLDAGLGAYAERDLEAVRQMEAPASVRQRADAVDSVARLLDGPNHVSVHAPPADGTLPLELWAAAGAGAAAWLEELPPSSLARRIADGDLPGAWPLAPRSPALRRELSHLSVLEAEADPTAAVMALIHGGAVLQVMDDGAAASNVHKALEATRVDHLGTAASSPDRVQLSGPLPVPDPVEDPAGAARWAMLASSMGVVDRLISAGTRWVVLPGPDAPAELKLRALCDDLRTPEPQTPTSCHLKLQQGDRQPVDWTIPRGEVSRFPLSLLPDEAVSVALAAEGRARYVAVALEADEPWRVPQRRAWYHLAHPGEPVVYRVTGPTRLHVALAPRGQEGDTTTATVTVAGEPVLSHSWASPPPLLLSDQAIPFGEPVRVPLDFHTDAPLEVVVSAEGSPVAVRIDRVVPAHLILPEPPGPADSDLALARLPGRFTDIRSTSHAPVVPRPDPRGTVTGSVGVTDRWSVEEEAEQQRNIYIELAATHRLRPGKRPSWLRGSAAIRFHTRSTPAAVIELGTYHRSPATGLRLSGEARGLIQDVSGTPMGAAALRGRLDRPTRIAPDMTLIPAIGLRGLIQPQDTPEWETGAVDLEIASEYRRQHPFAIRPSVTWMWRPWLNAALLLSGGATSNPDLTVPDSAGGSLEIRLAPRPFGLAAQLDLSWRFADGYRSVGYLYSVLTMDLWVDLGPHKTLVQPRAQLRYLPTLNRFETVVVLELIPGRRAMHHYAPGELPFHDIRGPRLKNGRWIR